MYSYPRQFFKLATSPNPNGLLIKNPTGCMYGAVKKQAWLCLMLSSVVQTSILLTCCTCNNIDGTSCNSCLNNIEQYCSRVQHNIVQSYFINLHQTLPFLRVHNSFTLDFFEKWRFLEGYSHSSK